jgi:diguanylate cyclase (GGDEF)-like protein
MSVSAIRRSIRHYFLHRPKSWLTSIELGGIVIVLLWIGIAVKHLENRALDLDGEKRDLQNFALLFEENVLRSIGEMDKALLYLRRSIEMTKGQVDYGSIVGTADILSNLIVQVAIIDANGIMRASNVGPQPAPATDLSDREHYRFHVGNDTDQLFISKPLIGRASGKWSVQLTRRFLQQDGTFGGVVVASFDPDHFKKFYGRVDLGQGATYLLIGTDGVVRASSSNLGAASSLGQSHSPSIQLNWLNNAPSDTFWDASATKGGPELVIQRRVAGHPLNVIARVPQQTVFADSTRNLHMMSVVGILFSLLIASVTRRAWILELQGKQKADQLQLTLEHMSQGIMMVTKDLVVPIINRKCIEILDLPPAFQNTPPTFDEMVRYQKSCGEFAHSKLPKGLDPLDAYGPHDAAGLFETYERVRPNGTVIEVRSTRLSDGGFVRTFSDITQRRQAQCRADRLASEDALTELANRRTLIATLDKLLAEHTATEAKVSPSFAVLYLDLDRFKMVNDTLGHAVGDQLLKAVAQRLRNSLRPKDFIARLGGDEFAVLLASRDYEDNPKTVAQRLVDTISQSYNIDGHQISIGVSIGIAMGPNDGQTSNQLLIAADLALYTAKAAGRCTYRLFTKEMNDGVEARLQMETDLRKAVEAKKLELNYQPIINLQKNTIVGFEALVRWRHPIHGNVSPDKFIPIAEDCGLIGVLGEWVLVEACRQAANWPKELKIAVNLSPSQFSNPDLAAMIQRILCETGLPPERLEVEITEGLLMRNTEINLTTLQRLKDLGVRVAMDDFGTGYSSLAYLQSFDFDKIKVDRSFVSKLGSNASSSAIVRAVIDIAGSRGMLTTAEGVETEAQRASLAALGCDEAQGYLFSRPVPLGDVPRLITNWIPHLRDVA